MRIFDRIRLALKNLRGVWAVLPAAGVAIAAFCLCFAGAILATVQQEKAQSYELIVSAEDVSLSDNDVVEVSQAEDVTAATAVLQVPATVSAGEYSAALTLTGVDADYLEDSYAQGGAFPDDSVMPYIVLNEAALKQFSDEGTTDDSGESGDMYNDEEDMDDTVSESTEAPDVDWLNESCSVQLGKGIKAVISKICGILSDDEDADEEQEPAAYISLSSAKELLQASGQGTGYTMIYIRAKNIGCADSISKAAAKLGLTVTNSTEESQSGWDIDMQQMAYLIVIGGFCLICAAVLLAAWRMLSKYRQKDEWEALKCFGLHERGMKSLFAIQGITLAIIGITVGVIVALVLPSFLSTSETADTNFMLAIPLIAVAISAAICIVASIIPMLNKRQMRRQIK